ncbi:MAG: hypothetical protein N2045_12445 [Fimbriimonadales bacterium]|jgi:hypothetical protein|nr:hypothetical protein [Fimbriimonadales bacterium]
MALTTVRGYYRNGQIELKERPEGVQEAEVLVIFMESARGAESEREQALERLLQQMREGFPFGGKGYTHRGEIYEERLERFPARDA